jgi:hypothetical protein
MTIVAFGYLIRHDTFGRPAAGDFDKLERPGYAMTERLETAMQG